MEQNGEKPFSFFFRLLRLGLGTESEDDKIGEGSPIDVGFAAKQGVGTFIFDGLQKAMECGMLATDSVPRETKMSLFSHAEQVKRKCQHHKMVIAKLADFYAEHGVRMMILKGYGLSKFYPKPEHRACGDIDIWVFGEQERADMLLHERRGVEIDYGHQHHTVFSVDGVMIENHFEFVNVISHLSNRNVECELRRLVVEGEPIKDEKIGNVYYPPVDFNALFLLRHAATHFATSEIALRHVTDWAMFVARHHKEIDWEWLCRFAEEQNMHKFLHCLNAICIDYLGMSADIFPNFEMDGVLEAKVMEDIMHPAFPERGDLRRCWWKNYIYTIRRWWGNRWKHHIVYREGLFVSFFVLLTSHYRTSAVMGKV